MCASVCPCSCKKPKITFRLEKWEKAVVFQVLDMDERFRSEPDAAPKIFGTRHLYVESIFEPKLLFSSVRLRGESRHEDLVISVHTFSSNGQRDTYYSKVLASLKEWSENWVGWNNAPACACAPATNEENVFSF